MKRGNIFTSTPVKAPNRNMFDMSFEVKMSGKFGYLYPFFVKECLPGDNWRNKVSTFIRFAPLLAPILHRIDWKVNFFSVPMRLLWDNWEDFITGGQDGLYTAVPPYVTLAGVNAVSAAAVDVGSLWDYMGLPTFGSAAVKTSVEELSVFPFRAYAKVWNDWYRDPNFDTEIELNTELDGNVTTASTSVDGNLFSLRSRGWEKDFFTSALESPQRGAEVLMPMDAVGGVTYLPTSNAVTSTGAPVGATAGLQANTFGDLETDGGALDMRIENIDEVQVSNVTSSINDLRRAYALQRYLEVNSRSGYRYNEVIFGHFSQKVPDYRVQRSEYLGGGSGPCVVSEVVATANSSPDGENTQPIGEMAGHGLAVGKSAGFSYHAEEHCIIIGIVSVVPRSGYNGQGLERMWTRRDKFDYAWPLLAHIGEQELKNKEVYMSGAVGDGAQQQLAFGYLPRFAEYKYSIDRVAGDFKTTLSFWTLNRIFTGPPALNSDFTTIDENGTEVEDGLRRVFYVQDGTDYLWMQFFHKCTAMRPLPYFGVPI